ncbi:PepSY domain-containing protein [Pararhizobium arenae]|uniref:PepSY domain-containing protein n=1 Tax=Pararhizobium arenae TaxID=1856850 RepID=UPI00094B533A|nr:PepSY domain-containing protein [Pararhizobium arenae]
MSKEKRSNRVIICLLAAGFALMPVHASSDTTQDVVDADDAREQYEARDALKQGKIRPLEEIVAAVREKIAGDIIEIEFEVDDGRYIYEIEIIQPSGQIVEIEVDALTKDIIGSEED